MTNPVEPPKEVWISEQWHYELHELNRYSTSARIQGDEFHTIKCIPASRVELMVKLAVLEERSKCMYGDKGYSQSYYELMQRDIKQIREQLQ